MQYFARFITCGPAVNRLRTIWTTKRGSWGEPELETGTGPDAVADENFHVTLWVLNSDCLLATSTCSSGHIVPHASEPRRVNLGFSGVQWSPGPFPSSHRSACVTEWVRKELSLSGDTCQLQLSFEAPPHHPSDRFSWPAAAERAHRKHHPQGAKMTSPRILRECKGSRETFGCFYYHKIRIPEKKNKHKQGTQCSST